MAAIVGILEEVYPDAACALEWGGEPWRLMVMGRLSAQCTDKRVNMVTPELFREFPTPQKMAVCKFSAEIKRIVLVSFKKSQKRVIKIGQFLNQLFIILSVNVFARRIGFYQRR